MENHRFYLSTIAADAAGTAPAVRPRAGDRGILHRLQHGRAFSRNGRGGARKARGDRARDAARAVQRAFPLRHRSARESARRRSVSARRSPLQRATARKRSSSTAAIIPKCTIPAGIRSSRLFSGRTFCAKTPAWTSCWKTCSRKSPGICRTLSARRIIRGWGSAWTSAT